MGDSIQNFVQHPTSNQQTLMEGLGVPLALAGTYLAARGSPLGAPLGLLGGGSLALGLQGGQTASQTAQNKAGYDILGKMGQPQPLAAGLAGPPSPPPTQQQLLGMAQKEGIPLDTFLGEEEKYQSLTKPPKVAAAKPFNVGGTEYTFDPATNTATPVKGIPKIPPKKGVDLTLPVRTELKGMGADPSNPTAQQINEAESRIERRAVQRRASGAGAAANAVIGVMDRKPYGSVSKDTVPVQLSKDAKGNLSVKMVSPYKINYGDAVKRDDIASIPRSEVQRFSRLTVLPKEAQRLKQSAQQLMGSLPGGPAAWANRSLAELKGDPRAAKLQTDLTILTENATSAFSRRTSTVIIDQLRQALASKTMSAGAVAAAADRLVGAANEETQALIQEGTTARDSAATGMISPYAIGGGAEEPLGNIGPSSSAPPPPPSGYE